MSSEQNQDDDVISHFGGEWKAFNYLDAEELADLSVQFQAYVEPLPNDFLQKDKLVIADFGAGSGRWAHFLNEYARELWLVEPGNESFAVLAERFASNPKAHFLHQTISQNDVPNESLDLAVSLGVLHHLPDTRLGIHDIATKIKPGGYFLCYLYYAMENKPAIYRAIWRATNSIRLGISKMPYLARRTSCELIAALIYFPLARLSKLATKLGLSSKNIPLHHYEDMSFYVMRNDAYDRFGTSLEQRFTKDQIAQMLEGGDFEMETLTFSAQEPFWTFSIRKRA